MKQNQSNNSNKTAIVTGSAGFIGQYLVKALKEQKIRVLTVPHMLLHQSYKLARYFDLHQPDYIFHLAAYGNMAQQTGDDSEIFKANVIGTFNLLQATKDIPYKAFINVSSSSVTLPHMTMYAATKISGEALCRAFVDEYNKPIMTVRPYSVYGPGEADYRFIPTVFRSCMTGEDMNLAEGAHDWICIDDLVDILIDCINLTKNGNHVINAGTGKSTKNSEVVELIEKITGKNARIVARKDMRSFDTNQWVSPDRYTGTMTLNTGLRRYYESITK